MFLNRSYNSSTNSYVNALFLNLEHVSYMVNETIAFSGFFVNITLVQWFSTRGDFGAHN